MDNSDHDHAAFMRAAIDLSRENMRSGQGGPFGAVIVRDGKIIGRGANAVTSRNDPTAHAEINAIRQACAASGDFSLQGAVIYSSCEPCPMCLAAIYWARLDAVYYGNRQQDAAAIGFDDAFLYRELALPAPERQLKISPLLRPEALAVFEEWQSKEDKIPY